MSDSNSSLVGSYVALQINAKAMVAEYADSPILALANALGTQKYVALVEKVRHTVRPSPRTARTLFTPKPGMLTCGKCGLAGGAGRLVLG